MGGVVEDKFVSAVEMPEHEVAIRAFEMSVHPITRGQWAEAISCHAADDGLPVTGVTFDEAQAFAAKAGARLPTEAEWEYACRAGSRTIFPQGERLKLSDANFLYDESGIQVGPGVPTPVACHPPNAFGLQDMIGNVCEWTADLWHAGYEQAPCDGSAWIDGGKPGCRVIRGGGWDHLPRLLRASWRDWAPESARWDNLGFRLARDLKP
jgi:formylglycine-generating enzyme required for sulfatase activity